MFKVVKVPSPWGVAHDHLGEVLEECDSEVVAKALLYQMWIDDLTTDKTLMYHLEVVEVKDAPSDNQELVS